MAAEPVASGGRQQRAGAERNRAQLLDTARAVIAEQGTTASLREIARRAGVSLPTLYRHFATRDDLLKSLLAEGFQRLAERADVLSGELPADHPLMQWVAQ